MYSGRQLSELALDVDTLRFQSFVDELQGRRVLDDENCAVDDCSEVVNGSLGGDITDNNTLGSVQVLQNSAMEMLTDSFDGVLVSSVAKGGLAWRAGIRAGDVLTATSATMGNKLWPKSTLDGVRSAISSRKVISPMMDFEFKRLGSNEEEGDDLGGISSFELNLSRPIGINVEGEKMGFRLCTLLLLQCSHPLPLDTNA